MSLNTSLQAQLDGVQNAATNSKEGEGAQSSLIQSQAQQLVIMQQENARLANEISELQEKNESSIKEHQKKIDKLTDQINSKNVQPEVVKEIIKEIV